MAKSKSVKVKPVEETKVIETVKPVIETKAKANKIVLAYGLKRENGNITIGDVGTFKIINNCIECSKEEAERIKKFDDNFYESKK